jgi:hypothetical protein
VKFWQIKVRMGQDMPRIDMARQISVFEQPTIVGRKSMVEWARTTQKTEAATERERALTACDF